MTKYRHAELDSVSGRRVIRQESKWKKVCKEFIPQINTLYLPITCDNVLNTRNIQTLIILRLLRVFY